MKSLQDQLQTALENKGKYFFKVSVSTSGFKYTGIAIKEINRVLKEHPEFSVSQAIEVASKKECFIRCEDLHK